VPKPPPKRAHRIPIPRAPLQPMQHAIEAYRRGNLSEAEALCRRILDAQAAHFGALNLLGVIAAQTRRAHDAAEFFGRAVAANPADAAASCNYGSILQSLGRLDEALASYDRALALEPNLAEAHSNRASVLGGLGRPADALASADRAIALKPVLAEAWNTRGNALEQLGQHAEALASYDRALQIQPSLAEAHYRRANALRERQRFEEALASYDRALAVQPDRAAAWFHRGNTLFGLRRTADALASFDRALAIDPAFADACNNRGYALLRLRRFADAAQCFARLLALAPELKFAKGILLHAKMLCCDWTGLQSLCQSIAQDVAARKPAIVPFGYQGVCDSERELRTCAEVYAAERYPPQKLDPPVRHASARAKIRIGYLSGDFRHQATSLLLAELFELHARERFEIVAFDNGWDDGSDIRRRINAAFDEIVDIARMGDREAAAAVRSREIDILVSLNGYFGDERQGVFAHRPSPIQVNYLGFPGTLGADYIDYLIADGTVIPEASRQHYCEKIAYLPDSYQANDRKRVVADRTFSRGELGLPESGFVFCCFNNSYKITPSTFDGWMRILDRVPGSALWLLGDDIAAAGNLRKEASMRGIAPERLVFAQWMPHAEHLARLRAADLLVDSLPYNAHTTASDALWVGLPVLTHIGTTFPGRVAASLLRAIDLAELVTTTHQEYERLAVELATHPQRLAEIRGKLEHNRSTAPLFDTPRFTRNIEDLYAQMVERYRAGLPPESLRVAS
jgi:predicted O-linked N-acetylglucosamine transferase (SPINDLY family)